MGLLSNSDQRRVLACQEPFSEEPEELEGLVRRPRQAQHRLTASELDELVARYLAGRSTRQLAREFEVHRFTVVNHLERLGIPRRGNVRKLSNADVTLAARLHRDGASLASLGKRFGVDRETVARGMRRTD
jgi:DNA-binding CsgD family transcriptional regulator